jgi:hypothetical protein
MGVKTLYVFWGIYGASSQLIVMDGETGTRAEFANPIVAAKHMRRLVDDVAGSGRHYVTTSFEPPFEQVYGPGNSILECMRLQDIDRKLFLGECYRFHK